MITAAGALMQLARHATHDAPARHPTSSNSRRSVRSASPLHLPRQSAPRLAKRATGVGETAAHAPARARTASVLPHPGGP